MFQNLRHYLAYRLGREDAVTQTTPAERLVLAKYATGKSRIVEIGVFEGVNSRTFRSLMKRDGVLIAIDPYPRSFFGIRGFGWARRIAHREVGKVSTGKVVWVERRGCDAVGEVKPLLPVDFIFIDGDHSWEGIEGDWNAWREQVAPGGIVALHDSRNRGGIGSERYTDEVILRDRAYEAVERVDSLTILMRRQVEPSFLAKPS